MMFEPKLLDLDMLAWACCLKETRRLGAHGLILLQRMKSVKF
jgi:hypothetical protein